MWPQDGAWDSQLKAHRLIEGTEQKLSCSFTQFLLLPECLKTHKKVLIVYLLFYLFMLYPCMHTVKKNKSPSVVPFPSCLMSSHIFKVIIFIFFSGKLKTTRYFYFCRVVLKQRVEVHHHLLISCSYLRLCLSKSGARCPQSELSADLLSC